MKSLIKLIFIITVSALFASSVWSEEMKFDQKFTEASNSFGFKLLKDLKTKNDNIMISPISIESALGALSGAGNAAETASILKTMGLSNTTIKEFNENNKRLLTFCKYPGEGIKLSIATSLWLNKGLNPNKNYYNFLKNYYNADISNVDFSNSKKSADTINNWCANKTNNMIKDAVSESDVKYAQAVLFNALYFYGNWTDQFNERFTREDSFYPYSKDSIKIDMMFKRSQYKYIDNNNFKAISVPYGKNQDFAIDIIIPENEKGLSDVLDNLIKSKKTIFESEKPLNGFVNFYLPKFQIEYKSSILDILKTYGLKTNDYKRMLENGQSNQISQIVHATKLKVDEKGTEAAVVTGIAVSTAAPIQEMEIRADKPFIFYIYSTKNNLIFFTGIVNTPNKL